MVSPRTRNVPRLNARSLRRYCIPTSLRSSVSRSIVSPTLSLTIRSTYSCGVPQPLHLVVDRGVLLDVGIGLRNVRLWLVVDVVRDEVLHGVVRQHLAQLVGELRGQRLVGQHDQRRPLEPLGQPGDGRRLAGAGSAEQDRIW